MDITKLKFMGAASFVKFGWAGVAIVLILCIFYIIMKRSPIEREYYPNGRLKKETFRKW